MSRSKRAQSAAKQAEKAQRERVARRNRVIRTSAISVVAVAVFAVAFISLGGTGTALTGDTGATTWDLPGLVDTEMQLAPALEAHAAMLDRGPLALSEDAQPAAVDGVSRADGDEVHRAVA